MKRKMKKYFTWVLLIVAGVVVAQLPQVDNLVEEVRAKIKI